MLSRRVGVTVNDYVLFMTELVRRRSIVMILLMLVIAAVSGATVSSRAVTAGVNLALAVFQEVSK